MLNHKTIFKQKSKSKIFITILCIFGLLFSYSCKCRNQVSDPNNIPTDNGLPNPDGTPAGTFSMSAATDNVVASIVKSSTTSINDIKISFVSANNYDYTMDYTVEDSETDEAKKLTKSDFQLANNVLTAKDSVATKVKLVDSSAGPVEKTITINFTFKAKDTSLKNNTQTLSVEVKLTRSQSLDDDKLLAELKEIGICYDFDFSSATVNNGVFSVGEDSAHNEEVTTDGFIPALNNRIPIRKGVGKLQKLNRLDYIDKVEVSTDKKTATFYFKLILNDEYDPIYNEETNPLKIDVKINTGTGTWKDTGTMPQS